MTQNFNNSYIWLGNVFVTKKNDYKTWVELKVIGIMMAVILLIKNSNK